LCPHSAKTHIYANHLKKVNFASDYPFNTLEFLDKKKKQNLILD